MPWELVAGHKQFREMGISEIRGIMNDHQVLVDVKGRRLRLGMG